MVVSDVYVNTQAIPQHFMVLDVGTTSLTQYRFVIHMKVGSIALEVRNAQKKQSVLRSSFVCSRRADHTRLL